MARPREKGGEKPEAGAFRSGFVALLGRPNVGKSTLLNALVGQKVSIVTAKPQTTRNRILGVLHRPNAQIVLLDTPGIHDAQAPLNAWMVKQALATLGEADGVVLLVEPRPPGEVEKRLLERLAKTETPTILAINKIDRVEKAAVLPAIEAYAALREFAAVVPISALKRSGLGILAKEMEKLLREGPRYFPEDAVTDQPMRFVAAEVLREKLMERLHAELPYSLAVVVERWAEEERRTEIDCTIYVERDSQKRIVVGKGGAVLRDAGTAARRELEWMTGAKVHLTTWVKVLKDWAKRPELLARVGYKDEA